MKILLTGGAGYLGSTIAAALESAGHTPVILDDFSNGPRAFVGERSCYEGDIADRQLLGRIVADHPDLDATVHLAAKIVVPESVAEPYAYYRNNVAKSLELFDELTALGKPRIVFSSSASLYVPPERGFEVVETDPVEPTSPYARTKRMMEQILIDLAAATDLRAVILRYFNPIGADPQLRSGYYEPHPTHVLPTLVYAASGGMDAFTITGTDWPTRDGSAIRDYIDAWDLAQAHVAALEHFDSALDGGTSSIVNVGTGSGVTVRELVAAFEKVYGQRVPVREGPPRPGDAVGAYANVDKAARVLQWRAQRSLEDAIGTAIAWGRHRKDVLGYL